MSNYRSEQARKAKNEYARKWRANNREKVKAAQDRYWARRAEREAQEALTPDTVEKKGADGSVD